MHNQLSDDCPYCGSGFGVPRYHKTALLECRTCGALFEEDSTSNKPPKKAKTKLKERDQ